MTAFNLVTTHGKKVRVCASFQKIREELTRALVEETSQDGNGRGQKGSLESFDELVREMTLKRRDIKAFASVTKKMVTLSNFSFLKKVSGHYCSVNFGRK